MDNNLLNKLFMLQIPQEDVFNKDLSKVEEFIKNIKHTRKGGYNSLFLTIDGYNHVKEELFEIKEVREWYVELFKKHPYIMYILNDFSESRQCALSCAYDLETFAKSNSRMNAYEVEEEYLKTGIMPQFYVKIYMDNQQCINILKSCKRYAKASRSMSSYYELTDWFRDTVNMK